MVTAPNDDWTEELCIRLIHEYRKRPILWDPKDPFFFKKAMKPEAWEGIGAALNMPAEICKHKMVILQSSFRREKSKIMQSIRESADNATCTSTWFAFDEMAFLIDKETERKRQTTGIPEDSTEDGPASLKRSLIEHYNEKNNAEIKKKAKKSTSSKIGTVLPNVCPKASPSPSQLKSPAVVVATTAIQEPPATVPPLVPIPVQIPARQKEDTLEEIKSFTNFIAYKMKKYSEITKNSVQQAICDIIFKADQNYYDNATFVESYNTYESAQDVTSEDCELEDKTIDIGNGQVIKLQMHHSE